MHNENFTNHRFVSSFYHRRVDNLIVIIHGHIASLREEDKFHDTGLVGKSGTPNIWECGRKVGYHD